MQPKPGELLITTLPNRTGLYLAVQETETRSRTLARFSGDGEAASQRFVEALVAAGFRHRSDEREEQDGVLREEAGEAGEYSGGRQRHGGAEGAGQASEPPGPGGAPAEERPAGT